MSTRSCASVPARLIAAAIALALAPLVHAQQGGHEGHAMPPPPPAAEKKAASEGGPATPVVDHAAMGHGDPSARGRAPAETAPARKPTAQTRVVQPVDHAAMDHAAMDHGTHDPSAPPTPPAVDHSSMGHDAHAAATPDIPVAPGHDRMDHGAMEHDGMEHGSAQSVDHAAMGHPVSADLPADAEPLTPIPEITETDRLGAAPPTHAGHETHDSYIHSYWLADRLEWQDTEGGSLAWEGSAWIGGDIHRVWLRTEGEASDGEIESGDLEVLYGRAIHPWWDAVAGVRQDFGEGPSRTYAAFGVQGLAPYKFEVEATAYVGTGGRTALTVEAEYDTLVTNRLILQWQAEASLHGKDDIQLGVGSGLSTVEAGARLRYEITRRFAPYVGVEFERAFGNTADLRREQDERVRDTRLVAGVRFWF